MTSRAATEGRYGLDAPGVILNFVLSALALGAAALLAPRILMRSLQHAHPATVHLVAVLLGSLLALLSLACSFLAALMLIYGMAGKHRMRNRIIDSMQRLLPATVEMTVLDIGTGRGLLAIAAAKHLPRSRVTALDIWVPADLSGNTRDNALANARAAGIAERIEFRHEDIAATALPDSSFDAILSLLCLHNIKPASQQALALQSIARLLKPGGVALLADYLPTGSYARALKAAGLTILSNETCFSTAYSLMWMVTATKPQNT